MYCRAIACDFDGTAAMNGKLSPEVAAALGEARSQGYVTLLVTGRVFEDLRHLCGDFSAFDAVVAENGAVVCLPRLDRAIQLGTPPPDHFLGELRSRGVPFFTGAVILGTWEQHALELLNLIRSHGIDGQLVFNRDALMLVPSGINKAVGVRRALEELGRSERNLVAFGDAENDLPMLLAAELGVAARGSVPAILAQADERLAQPGGEGVARYIHRLLRNGGIVATPPRHRIALGQGVDKGPATVPASGTNIFISGDPRSGKSWLAGLLVEKLTDRGYLLCLIDPEGDYASLGRRPGILTYGHELPLPPPQVVPRLFSEEPLSLVLNLSALPLKEQKAYVESALGGLVRARAATGIPHWILVDEAHYFFSEGSPSLKHLASRTGNFILATYRPSLVAEDAYTSIGAYLITRTTVEEERYFITKLLQTRGPRGLTAGDALAEVEPPRAGLLLDRPSKPTWQLFVPDHRSTDHAHHARKYADSLLPEERAFRFLHTGNAEPAVARNVHEFYRAVRTVPMASLRHHLTHGDFSRWASGVLGDAELARGLRKLEQTPGAVNREEILAHVADHYLIEDKS